MNRLWVWHTVKPRFSSETPSVHIVLLWEETGASHRLTKTWGKPANSYKPTNTCLTDDHSSNWSHRALTMFALWGPFFVPQARNMNIRLTGPVNKLFPLCSTSLWCPLMFYFWFVFPFFFFFFHILVKKVLKVSSYWTKTTLVPNCLFCESTKIRFWQKQVFAFSPSQPHRRCQRSLPAGTRWLCLSSWLTRLVARCVCFTQSQTHQRLSL